MQQEKQQKQNLYLNNSLQNNNTKIDKTAMWFGFFLLTTVVNFSIETSINSNSTNQTIWKQNKYSFFLRELPDVVDRKQNDEIYENLNSEIYSMDPLDQFNLYEVISIDLLNFHFSVINLCYYMLIGFIIFSFKYTASTAQYYAVYLKNWSYSIESLYHTVYYIVIGQIKSIKGQNYLPIILSLFIFILINNYLGLIPYSFASTSHFILTFSLSFSIVLGATLLGFKTHFFKFFSLFVPSGCPLGLLPLLVLIETISYLARNISLGLRLGANILSGHMLLSIVSSFILKIMKSGILSFMFSLIPIFFIIAFCGLECAIAIIQAQVFIVLACSYINDSIKLH